MQGGSKSSSSSSSSLPGSADSTVTPAAAASAAGTSGVESAPNNNNEDEGVPGDIAGDGVVGNGEGGEEGEKVEGGSGTGRRREVPLTEREGFAVARQVLPGRGEGLEMDLEALRGMRSEVNKVARGPVVCRVCVYVCVCNCFFREKTREKPFRFVCARACVIFVSVLFFVVARLRKESHAVRFKSALCMFGISGVTYACCCVSVVCALFRSIFYQVADKKRAS